MTESIEHRIMRDEERRNMRVYIECIQHNPWFALTHPRITHRHIKSITAPWNPPLDHDQED